MEKLTHINAQGRAKMVDVSEKNDTKRIAQARGEIHMHPDTLARIGAGGISKGDVLAVSQVAGVLAAKETPRLIPMCHPLFITSVDLTFQLNFEQSSLEIAATVGTTGKTGVEMEALTAVSVAALTIYDMCKAVDKDMVIDNIRLLEKSGGKSGLYRRQENEGDGSNEQR